MPESPTRSSRMMFTTFTLQIKIAPHPICLNEQFLIEFNARKNSGLVAHRGVHFRCFYAYTPYIQRFGYQGNRLPRPSVSIRSTAYRSHSSGVGIFPAQVSIPMAPAFPGQGHSFRPQCGPR